MQSLPLIRIAFLSLTLVAACGGKKNARVEPQNLKDSESKFSELKAKLLTNHLDNGWVVTRADSGEALDHGDSLLFSGLALAVLGCDDGRVVFDAIKASQDKRGGYFVRYEPLAESYKGNEVSRDGITGLAFGLIKRAQKCPDDKEEITGMWGRFRDLTRGALSLYPGDLNAVQTPGFAAFVGQVDHVLLGTSGVSFSKILAYQLQTIQNTSSVITGKKACYPVHLSTLQNYVLSDTIQPSFRREFCSTTAGAGLALTDWFCGESSSVVESWLDQYQQNRVGYAHQRCNWEAEDFSGRQSPALDWLVLFTLAKEGI